VSAPPDALQRRRPEIDAALSSALDRVLPRITQLHPMVGIVADQLRAFTAGGKRIRPSLLLLGFEAAGGEDRRAVLGPATALELLHTSALIHDDVIDRAPTRRGRPTVHHAMAAEHERSGWSGDPLPYGEAVAILAGDIAFVHADEVFLDAHVPDRALLAAFRRFTVLREEVMVGQYLDLQTAISATTSRELALLVATLKSGRYSVTRPLEIGAALAGADEALLDGLRAFGDPLGRAFQVRDDLLGVFGSEEATGKSASSDLAEGKRTLLVAEAVARLDDDAAAELEDGLGDPELTPDHAGRLRELLDTSGGREAAERYVTEAIAEARTALGQLALPAQAAADLEAVAGYLGDRRT
jgi:geranylgeranyl diphosphate synthase, type I